jgi:hypothetical protein
VLVMPLKYLDGEDRLALWLSDQPSWMKKLKAVEFTDEELAEIERIEEAYGELQQRLAERFDFNKFYV